MVVKKGGIRQWHFAHKPPYEQCDSDRALHKIAVAVIMQGFTDAQERQGEYRLGCFCEHCGKEVDRNVAVPDAKVEMERAIVQGTRSDLVVSPPQIGSWESLVDVVAWSSPVGGTVVCLVHIKRTLGRARGRLSNSMRRQSRLKYATHSVSRRVIGSIIPLRKHKGLLCHSALTKNGQMKCKRYIRNL